MYILKSNLIKIGKVINEELNNILLDEDYTFELDLFKQVFVNQDLEQALKILNNTMATNPRFILNARFSNAFS